MNHLNNDRFGDAVGFHQPEQRFRSGVTVGNTRAFGERKLRIVFPHVDVRIDNAIAGSITPRNPRQHGALQKRPTRNFTHIPSPDVR